MTTSSTLRDCAASLAVIAALCCAPACDDTTEGAGGSSSSTTSDGGAGPAGSVASSNASSSGTGVDPPLTCASTYTTVPDGECDLLDQDCMPGLSCEPKQTGAVWASACTPNSGLKGVGKACAGNVDCQPGLFCVFEVCAPSCCPDSNEPCKAGGGTCNVELAFGPHILFVCSYLKQCDLLSANACEDPNTNCHIQDVQQGLSLCIPNAGTPVGEGNPCMYLNQCDDMQFCQNGVCRYNCYVSAMGAGTPGLGGCPPMQQCLPSMFGIADVGICGPQ